MNTNRSLHFRSGKGAPIGFLRLFFFLTGGALYLVQNLTLKEYDRANREAFDPMACRYTAKTNHGKNSTIQ